MSDRPRFGLLATLEAKPGKEGDVATFLESALPIVEDEPGTMAWFAIRFTSTVFGIFDVFADDESREDHLAGDVATALRDKAPELFASTPVIDRVDVLAFKLPLFAERSA
jgi:quinol monooxygenase YgiN